MSLKINIGLQDTSIYCRFVYFLWPRSIAKTKPDTVHHIYGVMAELVIYGIGLNAAYNKSLKKDNKQSFSGFGGGTLFTNMDSMILDTITADRDADVLVTGISYEIGRFSFLYAYGNFKGDADSSGDKEHIIEQDIGFNYSYNKSFNVAALYNRNNDKLNSGSNDGNWDNLRFLMSYSF